MKLVTFEDAAHRRRVGAATPNGSVGSPFVEKPPLFLRDFFLLPFLRRASEAIRFRPRFDDMRPVREAIQQRLAQPRIRKNLCPPENGKFVVTISVARSARSAITWNKNSAPISASGT